MGIEVLNVRTDHATAVLPHGTYPGVWGGHAVKWCAAGAVWSGTTGLGIRTPNADVVVTVKRSGVFLELVKKSKNRRTDDDC